MSVPHSPKSFHGVMVSSTFMDLEVHRRALIAIINGADLHAVAMEHDSALPGIDVIDSSLKMVESAAAYVGIVSHKYGQVPECIHRNPGALSLSELEFNRALELNLPVLLFVMGDEHPLTKRDIESDPAKAQKLEAFRERAKRISDDTSVQDRKST